MIRKTRITLSLVAAAALVIFAGLAGAEDVMHGRVSFTDQSALVKGTDDADWSYAGVNSLIMPGDTVWADEQSALEIEFSGGTFLRLADGSKLDVVETPPNALFIGATGSFYVQRVRRSPGDVTFDTPVGAIEVAPDSQVRVDILEEGATTVTVRWGTATINAEGGAPVTLGTGERSFIDPGFLPSTPVVFDRAQEDQFDTWNRTRARDLAEGSTGTPIQSQYSNGTPPMGVSDLNGYGDWVTVDSTSYWRPSTPDYVPYRYGSWSYVPAQGYVWVDYYPWAYCTSHYGYWNYLPTYGWCWSYAGYYRPAYAYTLHYGDRFVWAPLNVYGYPVCYDSYASFYVGGIGFSYGFSSYCYDYYVWGGGYHNVWGVDYDCIYDRYNNHHFNDCDYWRIDTDKRPYKNGGQPHWPGDREDTFAPDRIYRGTPSKPGGTIRARDRAQTLEARVPSRTNQAGGPAIRTASNKQPRSASPALANGGRTRNVSLTDPSATRLARGSDLVRRPIQSGAVDNTGRSFTNEEARGARPLSHGSNPEGRTPSTTASRPSAPGTSGATLDRARGSVGSQPTRPNTDSVTQERPTTALPSRPNSQSMPSERPRGTTTSRPSQPRTQSNAPVLGSVDDYPAERPRPTQTRPSQPRPQANQPVYGSVDDSPAERPRPTQTRPLVAERERPVYNQPSVNRPQAEIAPEAERYPQYERQQPQVSRPQQQQYTRPEPQQPQYQQPQVSRPEPQRQQQYSRPEPQYSAPPQRSEPSHQSAPAPSYSDRGSFGGGGGSGGSFGGGAGGGGSSRSMGGGGGPSRSRGN